MNRRLYNFAFGFLFTIVFYLPAFAQVTSGSFTATCTDAGTVGWANGTNTTIIFAKAGSAVGAGAPTTNINTINANLAFGSGDAYQHDAAAFCVYKGTGTSANITGLTPGVTYHFLAFDAVTTTYSAAHIFNSASLSTPPNATALASTSGNGQVSLTWTNASCFDEALVVAKTSTVAGTPAGDGTAYTADPNFMGAGTAFDASGKVVYKNNSNSVTVTGLTNGTNYFFKVYTRKGTTWSAGVEVSAIPYAPATGGAFNTNMCLTTGTATWTTPGMVGTIVVFAKAGSGVTVGTPTNNISTYTADADFGGAGTVYQNDVMAKCVYKGASNSVDLTGLAANTDYHFLVFNASGTSYSASHAFNASTLTTPPNATGLTATPSTTSISFSWTNPSCFDEVMVVAKTTTVGGTPAGDGTAYTADPNFAGTGTTFDTSGKVVYRSNGNSVNVTGLATTTMYFLRVYTRKGTTWSAGAEVSTTTVCSPINVSALKISDAATTANLYWTDPGCFDEFMIVAKQGTASVPATITVAPTGDGTAYSAVANFGGAGTAFDGGKVVFKSGTNPGGGGFQTTGLTTGLIYTFKIFTRKGTNWSAGGIITTVPGPPVVVSFSPADNSTGVSTDQIFTVTFNENIFISSTGGVTGTQDAVLFDQPGGSDPTITRDNLAADGTIGISGKVATITLTSDLAINEANDILIGSKVFRDSTATNYGGNSTGTWNITTAAGVNITAPSVGTCVGQFTTLGDIVITENSDNNFQGTDNGSFTLVLGFNQAGHAFSPGTSGVSATRAGGGDIGSITVTSVTFSAATFTIQFSNVSNDGQAKDDPDQITISGLKVIRDGSVAPPTLVVAAAATTLTMQGITEGTTTLGTITAGAASGTPTVTWPNSNDNSYCIGTDLSTIIVTASGGSGYKWYDNGDLSGNIGALNGNATPSAAALGFSSAGVGTFTKYVTNSSLGCESSPVSVTLTITGLPTARAGIDPGATDPASICPGETVSLGGSPTANGGAGSYTYSWASTPIGYANTTSNPVLTAPSNTNPVDSVITYTVTITDGNGCQDTDDVVVTVKTEAIPVVITQPSNFYYAVNTDPIVLKGSPAGGSFSGVGVTQLDTVFRFDPELSGIGDWSVTYTAARANGCVGSQSQDFHISAAYDVFPNLATRYCNSTSVPGNEVGSVALTLSPTQLTEIQNYIANWNSVYVPTYGYGALKVTFSGIIRNEYETYYGDNNSVSGPFGTYDAGGGVMLGQYYFNPTAFTTDQAYPPGGGIYGTCPTCSYGNISIYVEFVNPLNTYPYTPFGGSVIDQGYYRNDGVTAMLSVRGEFVTVNPVPVVDFAGLLSSYCNLGIDYDLTGNKPGGSFEISTDGNTFADVAPADGIKDFTEGVTAGHGEFNPQEAFGSSSSSLIQYIRYSVDPGTLGSTGQGCIGKRDRSTIIYPSTPIQFRPAVPAQDSSFCYEGNPFNITIENQANVAVTTGVVYGGYGISDFGNGTSTFNPKTAFNQQAPGSTSIQDIGITVTHTNSQGCVSNAARNFKVRPTPTISYSVGGNGAPTPADTRYCYNEVPVVLQGNTPANTTKRFIIDYLTLTRKDTIVLDNMIFDPVVYHDNAVAGGVPAVNDATFNVSYNLVDQIGCTATLTRFFAVSPLDDVTITGIANGDSLCSNQTDFFITFGPDGGDLFIDGDDESSQLNATNSINFNDLPSDVALDIVYVYKSGISQCVNKDSIRVNIFDAPVASFQTTATCDRDPATFTADFDANNYEWTWVLGDSVRSGTTLETIDHVFPGLAGASQTSYLIKLIIENDPSLGKICVDSTEAIQVIGAYPNVDFNYADVCEDDFTRFSIISTNSIPIATAEWDFEDVATVIGPASIGADIPGGTHSGATQGKYGLPQHRFAFTQGQQNYFSVKLTARTPANVGSCIDSVRREVAILEKLTPTPGTPYDMSLVNVNGDGLWLREDRSDSTTWVFATPSGKSVMDGLAGNVWVTNATGTYKAKDNSYMNSPCFDLSAFTKPVFGMQYWNSSDGGKDGAVLQYSLNGGQNWTGLPANGGVIGTPTSGLNWYNNQTISSAPGGFNQYGWTGRQQDRWQTAKNALPTEVVGNNNVRFRIAFASDEREEYDGFAFNNVVIEERNRIMLVEHFSNTDIENIAIPASNNNYNNAAALNDPLETIKIQYHTSFPDADPINSANPADHNARAAFYGVTSQSMPMGFIDGDRSIGAPFGFPTMPAAAGWWNDFKQKRSLNSSPYVLTVVKEPPTSLSTEELQIRVTRRRIGTVLGNHPVLHVAVIELDAAGNQHVVRKLLPNAGGTAIDPSETLNQNIDEVFVWRAEGAPDLTDLAVVTWVQDEVTKNIQQTAAELTNNDLPTGVITGGEDLTYGEKIDVFPNPANGQLNIRLPFAASKKTPVQVIDAFGRSVYQTEFEPGEIVKPVKTTDFTGGVYIIQIATPTGGVVRKKAMVVHR